MLQRRYVNNAYAIKYDYGEVLYEIRAEVGSGMGVCFIGGVSDIGEFEMDNYYPYVCNNDLSSTEYVDIHKHTVDNLCTGSISDSRVGILIIYRLDNVGQYLDRMYNSIPLKANKSYLTGFSKSAKIDWFSRSVFVVVRDKLSPTRSKPLSTSVDTLSANIAMSTTYMRLIIFCRGDMGRFFIDIVG